MSRPAAIHGQSRQRGRRVDLHAHWPRAVGVHGDWLAAAKDLVARSRDALAGRPVWLFSSGPVGDPSRKLVQSMGKDPADLAAIQAATHARGHRMFAGKLDPKVLSLVQRASLLIFPWLKGDFRDWAEIRQWADSIAAQFAAVSQQ